MLTVHMLCGDVTLMFMQGARKVFAYKVLEETQLAFGKGGAMGVAAPPHLFAKHFLVSLASLDYRP